MRIQELLYSPHWDSFNGISEKENIEVIDTHNSVKEYLETHGSLVDKESDTFFTLRFYHLQGTSISLKLESNSLIHGTSVAVKLVNENDLLLKDITDKLIDVAPKLSKTK